MKSSIRNVGFAFALLLTGCVSVPPGPPPEIQRLQDQLGRLHGDPRIAPNAGVQNLEAVRLGVGQHAAEARGVVPQHPAQGAAEKLGLGGRSAGQPAHQCCE